MSAFGLARMVDGGGWELVPPRSVRDRDADLEEVRGMMEVGEFEIARDELVWLLSECRDLIDAHRLLGEIALADEDFRLARAHFGYAYELGSRALPKDFAGPLPLCCPANRGFLESCKGLAWSLLKLRKQFKARAMVDTLLRLDPSDPLGAGEMLAKFDRREITER